MISLISWVLFIFSPVLGGQHVAMESNSDLLNPPAQQLLLPSPKADHGLILTALQPGYSLKLFDDLQDQ